jgi:hypothetical protein
MIDNFDFENFRQMTEEEYIRYFNDQNRQCTEEELDEYFRSLFEKQRQIKE